MRVSGLDVALDPHPKYDDPLSLPVIVRGRDAVVEFEVVAASKQASWFPLGLLQVHQPQWVAMFEWRESEPLECVAAHAAAAALAKLAAGIVFGEDGIHGELAATAYRKALSLQAALPTT
jgi:hypothetical protein